MFYILLTVQALMAMACILLPWVISLPTVLLFVPMGGAAALLLVFITLLADLGVIHQQDN